MVEMVANILKKILLFKKHVPIKYILITIANIILKYYYLHVRHLIVIELDRWRCTVMLNRAMVSFTLFYKGQSGRSKRYGLGKGFGNFCIVSA